MAGRDTSYTHKTWRTDATAMADAVDNQLCAAVQHTLNDLVRVGAGKTQLADGRRLLVALSTLSTQTRRVTSKYDHLFTSVHAAQAAAGGLSEVAADKRYNQSG